MIGARWFEYYSIMVERVEAIVQEVLGLTESDRVLVIRRLIERLDGVPGGGLEDDRRDAEGFDDGFFRDPEIKQAWDDEIRRRIENMERGELKFTPGHEVVARIRNQLRRSRDDTD